MMDANKELLLDDVMDFDFGDLVDTAEEVTPVKPKTKSKRSRKSTTKEFKVIDKEDTATVELEVATAEAVKTEDEIVAEALTKIKGIEAYLNERFVEREEVVTNLLRTLIMGTNMLLLGEPGTGKSDIISTLTSMIKDANHFSWLLNRTSDPAELIGPYSIKAMEQDKFVRKTEGKLPEAHIAFLDEIFKCNEPTLNILLPLINEKIIYNGSKPTKVPLISMFAASNETPDDESLTALYDRILIRMNVEYVKDSANRQRMYELYATKGAGIAVPDQISLDELLLLQTRADSLPIGKEVFKALDTLVSKLQRNGIKISDRRQNNCLKIMRGSAMLSGQDRVRVTDLYALTYVLWEDEKDISVISEMIDKIVDPFRDKFNKLSESFAELKSVLEQAPDETEYLKAAVEAKKSLESVCKRIRTLIKDATKYGQDTTIYTEKLNEINAYQTELLQKLFNSDDSEQL